MSTHTKAHPRYFKTRHISVAHSPDADDLFMYYALNFGWIDSDLVRFIACARDIQTLNDATLRGEYDISAISFALYPLVCDDYALLRTGVSFGNGYGPKLIKKRTTTLKKGFKVALSGAHTTNALLFKLAYPHARIVYKNFLDIESSVLSGEVGGEMMFGDSKGVLLARLQNLLGISARDTLCVGDGANDVSMFAYAHTRVAFCAKDVLKKAANIVVEQKDLRAIIPSLESGGAC